VRNLASQATSDVQGDTLWTPDIHPDPTDHAGLTRHYPREELVLDESGTQTLEVTTLRRLRSVSLRGCRLTALKLWSPELVSLRLDECHALVSVDVRSAAAKSFEW
jgi:hypothetical protein